MRPPLRSVRMGFLKNIASPMRRWRLSEAVRVRVSASAIVRDWASVRVWVMVTWWSVGHGDVRVRGSARRERVGESRGESRRVGGALETRYFQ